MFKQIALSYKVYRVSSSIEEDYKIIKKIPVILSKLEKNGKDILILEIFNLLKMLSNVFDMNKLYLVICNEVDFKYHQSIGFLIDNLDKFSNDLLIKKFKEITNE